MKKLFMTVVALMGATTLFAQSDIVATFQQAVANAKAKNYTEAIDQFWEGGGFVAFDRAVVKYDYEFLRAIHKEILDAAREGAEGLK